MRNTRYILIIPENASQQVVKRLYDSLVQSGWDVVVSSDTSRYLPQAHACIVILSSTTINDSTVAAVLASNYPYLIPVLTERMPLPYANWVIAPILVDIGGAVNINPILQYVSSQASPSISSQTSTGGGSSAAPAPPAVLPPAPIPSPQGGHTYSSGMPTTSSASPQFRSSSPQYNPSYGAPSLNAATNITKIGSSGLKTLLIVSTLLVLAIATTVGVVVITHQGSLPLAPSSPTYTNMTGQWTMTLNYTGGIEPGLAIKGNLDITQNGSKITGTFTVQGSGAGITGSILGNRITLTLSISFNTECDASVSSNYTLFNGNIMGDTSLSFDSTPTIGMIGTCSAQRS